MSEPFIAEIKIFAGNFPPRNWAFCDGQLLAVSQNTALFSLVGTTYGGDGRTTFGLPDLRGRVPLHPGSGPGLTTRTWGQRGGTEANSQPPAHTHTVSVPANSGEGQKVEPDASYLAAGEEPTKPYDATSDTSLASFSTGSTGAPGSVDNMPPFLALYFIIALQGIYPSRS